MEMARGARPDIFMAPTKSPRRTKIPLKKGTIDALKVMVKQ